MGNKIVPTDRQVIEGQLLAALDDKSKVAILASEEDLDLLIDVLEDAILEAGFSRPPYVVRAEQFRNDLIQLRKEAFGS